jgi:tRNA(Ile)-lysidine synthase
MINTIFKDHSEVNIPLKLTLVKADISIVSNKTIFVDADKICLSFYEDGMRRCFQPFMNGKSKKVSKQRCENCLYKKENVWILCSDNAIVWVIGIRQDERF